MTKVYRKHSKQLWITFSIISLFLLTRVYIWFNPPVDFTEIIYSYMPYAHLWASGVKPYLEQWYEYPPATIPLFYLPHLIDRQTYGTSFHIDYRQAYRGIMLLADTALFALVWRSLVRFGTKPKLLIVALIYYCLITAKANHYLYDTMDWTFAAALALSASPALWSVSRSHNLLRNWLAKAQIWFGYWLAVALKLLNGPLSLPLALLQRRQGKTGWLALVAVGGLVWGLPLLIYRSSLSVMLLFHQLRGLQVDSLTAVIVRIINSFTQTESVIEIYKNYEITGPITTWALSILSLVFPLALIAFTGWTAWQAWQLASRKKDHSVFRVSITLGFVLLLMIVSKVLSRPFVLWHIPLIAMLPVVSWRQQLKFLVPSVIAVALTLSPIPDVPIGIFSSATLVGVVRSLAFVWLFIQWLRWHRRYFISQSKHFDQ